MNPSLYVKEIGHEIGQHELYLDFQSVIGQISLQGRGIVDQLKIFARIAQKLIEGFIIAGMLIMKKAQTPDTGAQRQFHAQDVAGMTPVQQVASCLLPTISPPLA